MQIARYKTAQQGPAYLAMTISDYQLLPRYVKRVRCQGQPSGRPT